MEGEVNTSTSQQRLPCPVMVLALAAAVAHWGAGAFYRIVRRSHQRMAFQL